jgi:signal peptidase I
MSAEPEEDYATASQEDFATAKQEDADVDAAFGGRRPRGPVLRWLRRLLLLVLIAAALASVYRLLFTTTVMVPDGSMYPTLAQGSSVLAVTTQDVEAGDLVLMRVENGMVLRRVLAGPGATVAQTPEGIVVDGALLPREVRGPHPWFHEDPQTLGQPGSSGIEMTCDEAGETVAGRVVRLCIDRGSERAHETIELAEDELYVRCDNRAFCAHRSAREGPVPRAWIEGRVVFLMGTRDDSDQPFYKRWIGRFESVD